MVLDELETLLLTHELRLNKFEKVSESDMIFLNLTHASSNHAQYEDVISSSVESLPSFAPTQYSDQAFH